MTRKVLLVSYPLLPVSEASAGGAEQILWTLERELARRGWETWVAGCRGSRVSGRLVVTDEGRGRQEQGQQQGQGQRQEQRQEQRQQPHSTKEALSGAPCELSESPCELSESPCELSESPCELSESPGELSGAPEHLVLDEFEEREAEHAERVVRSCAEERFELVLDHSGHFFRHAARVEGTVLATLHLPREMYAAGMVEKAAENVWFQCVSESQRSTFMDVRRMLGMVRNGIDVGRFAVGERKRDYLLWLGRVCPEKAPHLAIEAARRAGIKIVLAGQVYPFRWHVDYWERDVRPRIDGERVKWVPLPTFEEKARLLREARALLVTSLVAETTSLVALEAMASGTPVVAFRRGALAEVVPQGTGFLVQNVEEMAEACARVNEICAKDCRSWVEKEYSAMAMANGYERLMREVMREQRPVRVA